MRMWINLAILLVGTAGNLLISRRSLNHPTSHGFMRFFAVEAILGLVIVNAPVWFARPQSPLQLLSWILLIVAAILPLWAIQTFRIHGAVDPSLPDGVRISIEKTTRLVKAGPYRWIRHPMYAALLFLAWGIFFKHIQALSILLVILATVTLYLTARFEEGEDVVIFGAAYSDYMKRTRRFIPYIF